MMGHYHTPWLRLNRNDPTKVNRIKFHLITPNSFIYSKAGIATSTWNTNSMYFKIKALPSHTHMHTQWAIREFLLYLEKKCCSQQTTVLLFSPSVVYDFLQPRGLQHARLPCPSLSLWVCSNSCSLSWWCHPTISSSVIPFSSHLQSFPASGSLPVSQFFASDGQSIGASAAASVLPMNIQDWFPLEWTGLISLQSRGLSRIFSNTTVQKHQFFSAQPSLWSNFLIHTWLLGKTTALTRQIFVGQVMSLLFNTLLGLS